MSRSRRALARRSYAILATNAATLLGILALGALCVHAGVLVYSGTAVTETFDTLGTSGQDTTLLTGAGSFPNDGTSPWFTGVVATGMGNTVARVTGITINSISD